MSSYESTVVPIVQEAGGPLREQFGNPEGIEQKSESPADVVTELDRSTETFLAERLSKEFPDIPFVGEEFGGDQAAERYWLCDPIDGTAHFVRGIPFCTTMLALIENGEPVFSVIHNFVTKDMYVAEKGKGATKNGVSIQVSDRPLSQAYLAMEFNFQRNEKLKMQQTIHAHGGVPMLMVNCGFDYSQVAEGKIEGRICYEPFGEDYDYVAGTLLVREAGGVVRNIGSETYDFRNHNFTATNPRVYDDLVKLGIFE